jgi:hypothetical protein
MPIKNPWLKLTLSSVESVPASPGVYEVATLVRNTLFFGHTNGRNLRACLGDILAHQARQRALYFRYEETPRDEQRYRELLSGYKRTHEGSLPPLNDRAGSDPNRAESAKSERVTPRPALQAVS